MATMSLVHPDLVYTSSGSGGPWVPMPILIAVGMAACTTPNAPPGSAAARTHSRGHRHWRFRPPSRDVATAHPPLSWGAASALSCAANWMKCNLRSFPLMGRDNYLDIVFVQQPSWIV